MKNILKVVLLLTVFAIAVNSQWMQVTSPTSSTINSLQFVNSSTGYLAGALSGNVIKTTDGGSSWVFTVTGSASTFYDVYFENTLTGYVSGSSKQIIKTTNGGINWDIKSSGTGTVYSMAFPSTIAGYGVGGTPTVLNKSTDNGINWNLLTAPTSSLLKCVFFIDNNTGWVCGSSGTLWKTTDGCNSWIPQSQSSSFSFEKMTFANASTGLVCGANGVVIRTTNGGTNWVQQSTGVTANLTDICFVAPGNVWAIGIGKIIKSTDLGVTWGSQNNPSPASTFNTISMIDANTGYVGGSNGILLKTTNGGGAITIPCFSKITSGSIVNDAAWGEGCAWGDYDDDGDQDLVVTNFNDGCHSCTYPILLYRNDGGTFTRIMTGPIATEITKGFGCSWGDYDNDGRLDLYVAAGWDPALNNLLFHNEGSGNFTKVTSGSIVNDGGSSQSCAWLDYDKDGWLDMFVVNGNSENDFLYHNNGNGTFTRVTTGTIVNDGSYGRSVCTGDYDNDGWTDIFVTCYSGQSDRLYKNNGNGTFSLTNGVIQTDNSWGTGCAFGDYDNDGWLDLFVTNSSTNNFLYHNNNGTYTKILTGPGSEGGSSLGATWADYDNDGRLDLYVGNSGSNSYLYKNNGGGSFTKITDETISSEVNFVIGTSAADINMNGKIDFFASNNGSGSPQNDLLYQNNCTAGNYIGIKLKGCTLNRSGIGSRVIVKAGSNTYIREVSGGSGYHSQDMLWQLIGIGASATVDSVIIKWTTGNVQRFSGISANQYILADECLVGLISNTTAIPETFSLGQNYPNPFNPATKIKFSLPENSKVSLRIFDNLGKEMALLIDKELPAGYHEYEFDGSNLSSGIYFYKLIAGDFVSTKKMVLIK